MGSTQSVTASARSKASAVFRVTSGNFLEQFDFFLFGFYATYIAAAFSPASSEFASTLGKTVLNLSTADALMVTLLVGVSNVIWLPIGGALSDRVGRRPVLVTMAALAIFTSYLALSFLAQAPSFGHMLETLPQAFRYAGSGRAEKYESLLLPCQSCLFPPRRGKPGDRSGRN
jgi:MFS family permease